MKSRQTLRQKSKTIKDTAKMKSKAWQKLPMTNLSSVGRNHSFLTIHHCQTDNKQASALKYSTPNSWDYICPSVENFLTVELQIFAFKLKTLVPYSLISVASNFNMMSREQCDSAETEKYIILVQEKNSRSIRWLDPHFPWSLRSPTP